MGTGSASSSAAAHYDIASPRTKVGAGSRTQSRNPQDPKGKPRRKIDPNSENQKRLAKKEAKRAARSVSGELWDDI